MKISKNSDIPINQQLENMILKKIETGRLKPGDLVDSEPGVAKMYEISRSTVRNVYDRLVSRNILLRRPGKGTYVSLPVNAGNASLLVGFSKKMKALGVTPKTLLLKNEIVRSTEKVQEKLEIDKGEKIIEIHRIRSIKEIPFVIHLAFLPFEKCRSVLDADLESISLTSFIETELSIPIAYAEETVLALPAEQQEARLLDIKKGFPVLVKEGISYDRYNTPIRYSVAKYRSDIARLKTMHKKEI